MEAFWIQSVSEGLCVLLNYVTICHNDKTLFGTWTNWHFGWLLLTCFFLILINDGCQNARLGISRWSNFYSLGHLLCQFNSLRMTSKKADGRSAFKLWQGTKGINNTQHSFDEVPSLKLTWPLKIGHPKRKPSIFRCYVSFREGTNVLRCFLVWKFIITEKCLLVVVQKKTMLWIVVDPLWIWMFHTRNLSSKILRCKRLVGTNMRLKALQDCPLFCLRCQGI